MRMVRIILVHGSCHGAWCWYKVVAALRSQGYTATAIDLAACGADPRRLPEDISSFEAYSRPLLELMAAVPDGEKVVLVGHMFGGLSLALAMDAFPQKISVAVFLTAIMPDTTHPPSHIIEQHFLQSPETYADIVFKDFKASGKAQPLKVTCLEPDFLATHLYQNCSVEDLTLGSMMMRPTSLFIEELRMKSSSYSKEGYGSVDKVYIICEEDVSISADFQRWMIHNNPVKEVMEIKGADHMAMLSKPKEVCQCITSILSKHAS